MFSTDPADNLPYRRAIPCNSCRLVWLSSFMKALISSRIAWKTAIASITTAESMPTALVHIMSISKLVFRYMV